jgi:hypothetical protein
MADTRVEAHQCHFCGDWVKEGMGTDGKRHWLSDCRPDLVEHEPGPICTWHNLDTVGRANCYAYQNDAMQWTGEHKYFYPDGPM